MYEVLTVGVCSILNLETNRFVLSAVVFWTFILRQMAGKEIVNADRFCMFYCVNYYKVADIDQLYILSDQMLLPYSAETVLCYCHR